jgi:hypothetical protein
MRFEKGPISGRLLSFIIGLGFIFFLSAPRAAADGVTWVLEPADGQKIDLPNDGGAENFYLHYAGADLQDGDVSGPSRIDWRKTTLQGESGAILLRVGLQDPGADGLILQGVPHRGVSARIGGDPEAARLTTFVLNEGGTADAPGDLGLDDPSGRIAGARLFLERGRGETFALMGTASVIWGPNGARAWSLSAETPHLGPFCLAGEVAGTGSADEGQGSGLALAAGLSTAAPLPVVAATYHLSLDWKRVGAQFTSPGFPSQENNAQDASLHGGFSWWAFGFEAGANDHRENVDRLPGLPDVEIWQTSLNLTLHPRKILQGGSWPFFLEHPVWNVYYKNSYQQTEPWDDPQIAVAQGCVSGLRLHFGMPPCAWELDWSLSTQENFDQQGGQVRTRLMGLQAFLGASPLQLNPFVNLTSSDGADSVETTGVTTGLATWCHPQAPWRGNLAFSMNWQQRPGTRNESLQVSGHIAWSGAGGKTRKKPGVEVSLDGGYRTTISGDGEEDPETGGYIRLSFKIPLFS